MRNRPPPRRILIADDDVSTAASLFTALRLRDFDVVTVRTGREAVRLATRTAPDVVVLDVGLPDIDGFATYQRLRDTGVAAPVLFLGAGRSTSEKVYGLTLGGDDYVCKPFDVDELVARIEVLIRRGPQESPVANHIRVGTLDLELTTRVVSRDGRPIPLSATEFKVLQHLMSRAGTAVPKAKLLAAVWGVDTPGGYGVVETYIYYLRRKLGGRTEEVIRTVRNVGYLLSAPPDVRE